MNHLMVSPWAPYRDGIASYAQQEVRRLRADGHEVTVLSPLPSAAHAHLPLGSVAGAARLARRGAGFERVIVQFGPELLFGRCRSGPERVAVWAALAGLARATSLELRIHEIEYERLERSRAEAAAAARALAWADAVTVHTEAERAAIVNRLGSVADCIDVVAHGRYFSPAVDGSPQDAKADLGLDPERLTLLCIGFLQRHKGFDLAIEALVRANLPSTDLHIVGSGRIDHPEIADHLQQLRAMAGGSDRVFLHEGYVSDELFDRWLLATDVVVLPYREIWSSGVVERARLFGKPIIASDLPQLRDQLPADAMLCNGVAELAEAMTSLACRLRAADGVTANGAVDRPGPDEQSSAVSGDTGSSWDVDPERPDRARIQAEVERRAARDPATSSLPAITGPLPPSLLSATRADPGAGGTGRSSVSPGTGSRHLEQLGRYQRPPATSARPLIGSMKRSVQTLTNWQMDPLTRRVDDLHQATVEAVLELEARLEQLERREQAGPIDERPDHGPPGAGS